MQPGWQGDALNDSDGLSGEVRIASSGSISIPFRYGFKLEGKKVWYYCGTYPATEMSKIRVERDKARAQVKSGVDPRVSKKAFRIEAQAAVEATIKEHERKQTEVSTLQDLYEVWIRDGVSRSDENNYIKHSFTKHALPFLGSIEIRNLTEHHLRDRYRAIIKTGKVATAVELSKDIGQMLRWAEERKPWRALMADGNPSKLVKIALLVPKGYSKERKRELSHNEIRKLKKIFEETTSAYEAAPKKYGVERPLIKESQIAIWLCLSTLCRIGELLLTEWKHVDFEHHTWFIPAANTKGEEGQRREQLVYLSNFAFKQFQELHALTKDSSWAFPARYKEDAPVCEKSVSKQVGDRQIKFKHRTKKLQSRVENNTLVLGEEEWTPHDLRRTGATLMQKLKIKGVKVSRDVVNLCQNHVIGTKVDRVYLLDDYADEKREAWLHLGKRIEEILHPLKAQIPQSEAIPQNQPHKNGYQFYLGPTTGSQI